MTIINVMTNLQVNIVVMVVVMYVVLRARKKRKDDTFLFWYESVHLSLIHI